MPFPASNKRQIRLDKKVQKRKSSNTNPVFSLSFLFWLDTVSVMFYILDSAFWQIYSTRMTEMVFAICGLVRFDVSTAVSLWKNVFRPVFP